MNTFSIREALVFGWETFKKRPWFFMGVFLFVFILSNIGSSASNPAQSMGVMVALTTLASLVVGLVLEMGLLNIALKSHDSPESLQVSDAWTYVPFLQYLGVKLLGTLIVIIGLLLLIIPGIIAALALMFSNYLVMDKRLGVMDALKESARITKGHRWQLFLFGLTLVGINLLGLIALFVGLFVTIPVSILATVHVYRTLEHRANELATA